MVAKALGTVRLPVAARIVGDAPNRQVADATHLDASHHEFDHILQAEPRAKVPELGRALERAADAHGDALDPVLVPVHPGYGLAPRLAEPVDAVRAKWSVKRQSVGNRVHAEGMVRTGEDDPADAVPARALVHLIEAAQVVLHN